MAGSTAPAAAARVELAAQIADELSAGVLKVGDKLPSERELASRLGVSRPVVREVLRSLEERGLIEVSPGRGAFVREASMTDLVGPTDALYRRRNATPRDVVEVRAMIEPSAAALAADRHEPADLLDLERILERFAATEELGDRARWDIAFHAAIARASRNPVLETIFASIAPLTFELMLRSLGDPSVTREGVPYHDEILDAIVAREPDRARAAMSGHLSVAVRLYGNDFDRGLDAMTRPVLERALGPGASLTSVLEQALRPGAATAPPVRRTVLGSL